MALFLYASEFYYFSLLGRKQERRKQPFFHRERLSFETPTSVPHVLSSLGTFHVNYIVCCCHPQLWKTDKFLWHPQLWKTDKLWLQSRLCLKQGVKKKSHSPAGTGGLRWLGDHQPEGTAARKGSCEQVTGNAGGEPGSRSV